MTKFEQKRFTPVAKPDRSISQEELDRRWKLTFGKKRSKKCRSCNGEGLFKHEGGSWVGVACKRCGKVGDPTKPHDTKNCPECRGEK